MNDTPPTPPANPPKKSGKKGCLIGCLAAVAIAILLAVIAAVVVYPYVGKGMKLARAGVMINEIITTRIADADERVVVLHRASEEFGKLLQDKGFDQDDLLATVSNLVERVIAERAKAKTEEPENEPVDD